jgi:Lrp/AsnC family leucine-responsive transcriptional regulator
MRTSTERLLDDIGWRILAELQADARIPWSRLGRRVGLSAPAVAERVRQMQDAGIITGFRVDLGLDRLGFGITALVQVSAPESNCLALGALVRRLPGVIEVWRVTGEDRLVVRIAATSVAALDEAVREMSRFGTATVSVVLRSFALAVGPPGRHGQRPRNPAGTQTARGRGSFIGRGQ